VGVNNGPNICLKAEAIGIRFIVEKFFSVMSVLHQLSEISSISWGLLEHYLHNVKDFYHFLKTWLFDF